MIKSFLNIVFILLSLHSIGQEADVLFKDANANYQKAAYTAALETYKTIDSMGLQSADLYYNMANSYYKLNQVAPSIYFFEKALLLNPAHKDAKHNLVFAKRMTIDAIAVVPKSLIQQINEAIIYPLSYNTWAWISVLLAFLTAVFFLLYYFLKNTSTKRTYFVSSILSFVFFLLSLSFSIKSKHQATYVQPAIIFDSSVSVKSEPLLSATESFVLHEGTKVYTLENVKEWTKIKLEDGQEGWVINSSFKRLK